MVEELLIEAVRCEKSLYDITHPDYLKFKLKNEFWRQIAEELDIKDGKEAKRIWEKLRNSHREALRRRNNAKTKNGSPVNLPIWRYQENMAFLVPHMANRITNCYTRGEIHCDEETQAHSITTENDHQENRMDNEEPEGGNEESNQSEPSPSISQQVRKRWPTGSEESNQLSESSQVRKRRRNNSNTLNDLPKISLEEHAHGAANRQQEREPLMANTVNDFTVNGVKNDALLHFFISMYETTKRLPPLSQLTIKTNIFSLVSKEESKNLIQHSPRPHSSNTQISDVPSHYSSYHPSVKEELQSEDSSSTYADITNNK